MARFKPARVHFGDRPPDGDYEDDGTGLPTPIRTKATARRTAGVREARAVLEHLPGPGESLHAVCTARLDLTDVVTALVICSERMLEGLFSVRERRSSRMTSRSVSTSFSVSCRFAIRSASIHSTNSR